MEERRTRSQDPPSLSENNELIQWDSLQDPVSIEREHAEACRLARQANTTSNVGKNMVENSEISQTVTQTQQDTEHMPKSGEISPKQQGSEGQAHTMPMAGEISPQQQEITNTRPITTRLGEISQEKTQQIADLVGMEEGALINSNRESTQQGSPQIDTAEHYLDDNLSDVM